MGVIILFVNFLLLWFFVFKKDLLAGAHVTITDKIRISFVLSAVLWAVCLVLMTELLSLLWKIDFVSLSLAWTWLTLPFVYYFLRTLKRINISTWQFQINMTVVDKFVLFSALFVLAATLLVALLAPPNNGDSMTYHMARVAHWVQNGSVGHYPTHNDRQLSYQPLAEYIILHFQLLSGSDHLANGVQWFSLLGSVIGISMITKTLGGKRRTQLASMLLGATVPMAILQASSTQNDLVVSFFLIVMVYLILSGGRSEPGWRSAFIGGALGLALLTKGTAYIFALPFLMYHAYILVRQKKIFTKWFVRHALLSSVIVLLLNAGYFARNTDLYGHPFGNATRHQLSNEVFSIPVLISNLERNVAYHLYSPSDKLNKVLDGLLFNSHVRLGLSLSDPRTTYDYWFIDKEFTLFEDTAKNFLHTWLILLAGCIYGVLCFIRPVLLRWFPYMLCLLGNALLYSFYLRWQPWCGRLQTPVFMLFAPFAALVFNQVSRWGSLFLMLILFLAALPYVFYNQIRPVLPIRAGILYKSRLDLQFVERKQKIASMKRDYPAATRAILHNQFKNVGLEITRDDWDYPFYDLLKQEYEKIRIEHVNVTNCSSELSDGTFVPDCILSTVSEGDDLKWNGRNYYFTSRYGMITLYTSK